MAEYNAESGKLIIAPQLIDNQQTYFGQSDILNLNETIEVIKRTLMTHFGGEYPSGKGHGC